MFSLGLRRMPRIRHNVIARSLVIPCLDARYLEATIFHCGSVLRLGRLGRDWILQPIAGGAAAFAHPDRLPDYFGTIETQLKVALQHFPSVEHLIIYGHFGCNFVANVHRQDGEAPTDLGWAFEDCQIVARAVNRRRVMDGCKIGGAVRGFRGNVSVWFTRIKEGTTATPEFLEIEG